MPNCMRPLIAVGIAERKLGALYRCFPAYRPSYRAVQPPSTWSATPLSCAAASEQRNAASAPSCSGVVNSREGLFLAEQLHLRFLGAEALRTARASNCFFASGVSTQPGQIAPDPFDGRVAIFIRWSGAHFTVILRLKRARILINFSSQAEDHDPVTPPRGLVPLRG